MLGLKVVLQFGGSTLQGEADLLRVVHEIYRWYRRGYKVVAVTSSFGGAAGKLLDQAESRLPGLDVDALLSLVADQEQQSAILLAAALDQAGVPAELFQSLGMVLETYGPRLSAQPWLLDVERLLLELEKCPVIIIPGLIGRDRHGSLSAFGRNGADISAVFIAHQLDAKCRLLKDVDGVYGHNPKLVEGSPRRDAISFDDMVTLEEEIVHPVAIEFARKWNDSFEVGSVAIEEPTIVGDFQSSFAPLPYSVPVRVGLLGLGTVGLGVFHRLLSEPGLFTVTGVAVANKKKERDLSIPDCIHVTEDPEEVIQSDCDVVIELIGGLKVEVLVQKALKAGKHVITANKLLMAQAGASLYQRAKEHDVSIACSAAVGGAVPMLETVSQIARHSEIVEIAGVLNGTCNFILDQLMQGCTFDEALRLAKLHGFTEADPTQDLDGTDAASKLLLLAQAAFGSQPVSLEKNGILSVQENDVRESALAGSSVRLVGRLVRDNHRVRAGIGVEIVAAEHPFSSIHDEHNCLILKTASGQSLTLRGRGAGRWPTAEAVFADVLDVWRLFQANAATTDTLRMVSDEIQLPAIA